MQESGLVDFLLTGTNGQVGGELLSLLRGRGSVLAPLRAELDLQDANAIREVVRRSRPRWIVNPAAYTAVDKAETDADTAFALNEGAVRVLGEEAARCGAVVLHFSTDYVFDGSGTRPWRESDAPHPLGVYGASKLAGELALQSSGAPALIFRTSWVYGATGKNFLRTILRAAREREELRIVDDQWGAPTWSRNLAQMIVQVIQRGEELVERSGCALPDAMSPLAGVYHACDAGETTWFGFANRFLAEAKSAQPHGPWARCLPVSSEGYCTPTKRPTNSRLDCSKLQESFGIEMPTWEASASAVIAELMNQSRA